MANVNSRFWKDKRVLVTGHTGFKGSWLVFWLKEMGAQVSGLALEPSTTPSAFTALEIADRCEHHIADIRDAELTTALIRKINPEVVFHMAAQPLVRLSYEQPMETYATNVLGTGNVLLALRDCPAVRSVVVVTTDKCYENREWDWGYRETDALGGYDPYSSSKACTEILTASFRRSFFSPKAKGSATPVGIATARAGNVIGGGDWSLDRLIPDIVRSYSSGTGLSIRHSGAIRPWQHVLMPLSGYLMLAEKLFAEPQRWSEAFNFAPRDEDCVPVGTIIEQFGKAWGKPVNWSQTPGPQPHEAHFLKLDASKAISQLGWRPRWSIEKTMTATAQWYREHYDNPTGIAAFTKRQIADACEA